MNIKKMIYKNTVDQITLNYAIQELEELRDTKKHFEIYMNLGGSKNISETKDITDLLKTLNIHFGQRVVDKEISMMVLEGRRYIKDRPYILTCEGTHTKYHKKHTLENQIYLEEKEWCGAYNSKGDRKNWIQIKYITEKQV